MPNRQKLRTDPRPRIHAIFHTTGATDDKGVYVPLEIGYKDVTGLERHFFIQTLEPVGDCQIRLPSTDEDSWTVTTLDGVYAFLRKQCKKLSQTFGFCRTFFGYKGKIIHSRFLSEAGVSNMVNVDLYGVRSLQQLDPEYGGSNCCSRHVEGGGKCALSAVRLMADVLFKSNEEKMKTDMEALANEMVDVRKDVEKCQLELSNLMNRINAVCEKLEVLYTSLVDEKQ